MPVHVEFIKEKRVVLQTYSDPLDNAQMHQLKNKMEREILPAAGDTLHIIVDLSAIRLLPGTVLTTGSNMLMSAHPNAGTIICIAQNNLVQSIARVFGRLSPRKSFKIVRSLDEAYMEIDRLLAQEA